MSAAVLTAQATPAGPGAAGAGAGAGASITERLVVALSATWRAIQQRHPDVPDVVLTIGSGTIGARRGEVNLGHFAASRWFVATPEQDDTKQDDTATDPEGQEHEQDEQEAAGDAEQRPGLAELFVGGEGLRRGARSVLATLLHEAGHGVATVRGIKDTSREGRYHNKRFRELGEELGLLIEMDGNRGWSGTRLPAETAALYPAELAQLADAITAYRRAESGPGEGKGSRNSPPATCGCVPARRIRVSKSVLALGPIVCSVCEAPFEVEVDDLDGADESGDESGGG